MDRVPLLSAVGQHRRSDTLSKSSRPYHVSGKLRAPLDTPRRRQRLPRSEDSTTTVRGHSSR
eukprot:2164702-Pyramimonas_sp.AAC.1